MTILALVTALSMAPATQPTALGPEMTPFVIPWDDAVRGTATDVSFLNEKPAGKHGPIVVRNGVFVESKTGRRVRFFATNLGAAAAFPTRADADRIAARLAKHGVNLVRFHHLQNDWDVPGGTIWKENRMQLELDPKQLDRLDYFIYALKKQGIYTNMNLQTTRKPLPEMGLPESVRQLTLDFGKQVDKFYPRLIELQEEYAKALLDRVNPYTKLHYRDDPALAKIEINNENSLVGWPGQIAGADLSTLPEPFRGEIKRQWNVWLQRKYPSQAALQAAWTKGNTTMGPSLLTPDSRWTSENQSNADVTVTPGEGTRTDAARPITVQIENIKGPDWHIQSHLPGLTLRDGDTYTLTFEGRADRDRSMGVTVNLDKPDWRNVGLAASTNLTPSWRPYSFVLRATNTEPAHVRVAFVMGGTPGQVQIRNVRLRPGSEVEGVGPGESLSEGTIALPNAGNTAQGRDFADFLTETETRFSNRMRRYVKNTLGFRNANVIDTQISWGGLTGLERERAMEYADNHAYWQHPAFLGSAWDPARWRVERRAMVNEMDRLGGELGNLALTRILGKPYAISEYNHPAPNDFQVENMLLFAAVAAYQDWDAIYTFDYGLTGTGKPNDRIQGFFGHATNPSKFAYFSTAALIFRTGQVPPARALAAMNLPRPAWHKALHAWEAWGDQRPSILTHRVGIRDVARPPYGAQIQPGELGALRVQRNPAGAVFTVNAPQVRAWTGFTPNQVALGSVTFTRTPATPPFAAVTLTALDGRPVERSGRLLLTAMGRAENVGMGWNAERDSVSDQWGTGPVHIETVPLRIQFRGTQVRKAYVLDPNGRRRFALPVTVRGGVAEVFLQRAHRTAWLELTK